MADSLCRERKLADSFIPCEYMDSFLDAIYEQKRNQQNKNKNDVASIHEHYLIGPGFSKHKCNIISERHLGAERVRI